MEGPSTCRLGRQADLPQILAVASAWPAHFVPRGLRAIAADFAAHCSAVIEEDGAAVAFVVWLETSLELEILWVATHPRKTRRGFGARLVRFALEHGQDQVQALVKTASEDAKIDGTCLDGFKFHGSLAFFESLGFRRCCRLDSFWGPEDHALLLSLPLF